LPEKGKLLISGREGTLKTFLTLNLACAIASGISPYLGVNISKRKVLYVSGEGGEAEMRRRLEHMATALGIDRQNLILAYKPSLDIFSKEGLAELERLITESGAEVLILDPIGQFWLGKENDKEDVRKLTKIFDALIEKHRFSLIISHHWRKSTQHSSSGGQMPSGSYWWTAWVDGHITLKGNLSGLIMSLEKVRSGIRPKDKLTIRLKDTDLWLECIGKTGEKVSKEQLDELFASFGLDKVKLVDLAAKAEEKGYCSRNTLEKIIKQDIRYSIEDPKARPLYVVKEVDNGSTFKT